MKLLNNITTELCKYMEKPFIYLAFANQENVKDRLLALYKEMQSLKIKLMLRAIGEDLIYAMDENVGDSLLSESFLALKSAKERPKIIHFAGHADMTSWRLKDNKQFDSDVINTLLSGVENVKLVFMNACSTEPLKKFFLEDLKVDAVIATDQSIDDNQAFLFSTTFYNSLLYHGNSIKQAFTDAVGMIEMSVEVNNEGNVRGFVMKKGTTHKPWGLSWRDEIAEKADFKIAFSKGIPDEQIRLGAEYEEKSVELRQIAIELKESPQREELEAIPNQRSREYALKGFERDTKLFNTLNAEVEALREKLIGFKLPTYIQSRLDEFNFDNQMLGMVKNCQGANQKFRTGAYILRGTEECGLGFLIKKIATSFMLTAEDTIFKDDEKKPIVLDFKRVSSEQLTPIKELQKRLKLPDESNLNVQGLATAFVATHLKIQYSTPFILIFDNLRIREHRDIVQFLILEFWVALHKALKKAGYLRPVLFLIVERRPLKTNPILMDIESPAAAPALFNANDFIPQDTDFLNDGGLVHFADDVSEDVISVKTLEYWCISRGFLFTAWAAKAKLFLDPLRPRVQPTLLKMVDNLIPADKTSEDKAHNPNDPHFQSRQYILAQDQLNFCKIW